MGCLADKLKNPKLKVYYYTAGNSQIRVALTADMMKLAGAKIPPTIVFPIQLQQQSRAGHVPQGLSGRRRRRRRSSRCSLLQKMYP